MQKLMRKKLAVASAVTLILLFFIILTMKKKIASHLITGLVFALAGIFIGYSLKKNPDVKYIPSATVYKDTCVENKIICKLTMTDSLSIYNIVRKGNLKTYKSKPLPEKSDTNSITVVPDCVENTYVKTLDNGFTKVFDTLLVKGKILDWSRSYQMDTLQLTKEVIRNTVSVVREEKSEDTIQVIEIKKKPVYLGPSIGFHYDKEFIPITGVNLRNDFGSVTFALNPRRPEQFQVSIQAKVFRIRSR